MKYFTIENETNNIMIHGSAMEAEAFPNSERFSSEAALAKLAADWPAARLVEVWNGLPGETRVKKFKDRAAERYRGFGKLDLRTSTRLPRLPKKPRWFPSRLRLLSPRNRSAAGGGRTPSPRNPPLPGSLPPQSPDVAPEAPPTTQKATRAKKAPAAASPRGSWCTPGRQQDEPGYLDAQARGRYDAGGDHVRDAVAKTYYSRPAQRGGRANEESRADRNQREGGRETRLLHQIVSQNQGAPSPPPDSRPGGFFCPW